MRRAGSLSPRMLAVAGSVALLATPLNQQPAPAPAPAPPAPYTYVGTVRAMNPAAGTMDLITGVGHALRMVHMSVAPGVPAVRSGAAIQLADIAPGAVVRVECHMTPAGLAADRIEAMPDAGGGRRP